MHGAVEVGHGRQSGRVGQQMVDGGLRRPLRVAGLVVRQVLRHRIVHGQLAGLLQLHDRHSRESLRGGAQAHDRVSRHGELLLEVPVADPLQVDRLAILGQAEGHAGEDRADAQLLGERLKLRCPVGSDQAGFDQEAGGYDRLIDHEGYGLLQRDRATVEHSGRLAEPDLQAQLRACDGGGPGVGVPSHPGARCFGDRSEEGVAGGNVGLPSWRCRWNRSQDGGSCGGCKDEGGSQGLGEGLGAKHQVHASFPVNSG